MSQVIFANVVLWMPYAHCKCSNILVNALTS
jgi:hypothetical protein